MKINFDTPASLFSFAGQERQSFEAVLREFVEIPTVSAEPGRDHDMARAVELAVETIRRFGGEAEVLPSEGRPLIHGRFHSGPSAPTVTVYNHLDVQPASQATEPWRTDPFKMVIEGDRYLGRGTTDDKGPAISALFGIRAAREAGVPLNMNLLWELEEEIGSPSFEAALIAAGDKLHTDSVVVSDTIWVSREQPACPSGLRGLAGFTLSLETAETDQHSGTTGGAARNPIGELIKLVAEMYDATTGKVQIKGFYDDVLLPSESELDDFRQSGFSVEAFKKDHQFHSIRTDDPLEVMKLIWALPTMEVHGLAGGYTGIGIKTIVPPRAEAKISCRLVPNQNPAKINQLIREFVRDRNPDVKFVADRDMQPYQAPTKGALPDTIRRAMKFAFGREPVFIREGGSIGAVISMETLLRCPIMFLGLSLPEHGYHAPNENFDWMQASGGIVAFAKYFSELSKLRPAG